MKKIVLMTTVAAFFLGIINQAWTATCDCVWSGSNNTELTITNCGGDKSFTGCSDNSNHISATEVTFGEGVMSIGEGAFASASSLVSVDMPNIISIGAGAFWGATSLTSVDMPNVETIGYGAFMSATSLIYAGINPEKNVDIGTNAFSGAGINCYTGAICKNCSVGNVVMPGVGCTSSCSNGYTVNTQGLCKKNSASSTCPPDTTSIAGDCLPRRYTPAELSEIVGESNTILLYYK